jgi:DNA replication protein DnaC
MMAKNTSDIEKMLDYLKLDKMAESLNRLARTPDFPTYTPIQALREIITEEYIARRNSHFEKSLSLGKLKGCNAQMDKLRTGNGRIYNDNIVGQLATLEFIQDRKNLCILGESGAGKTYAAKAFGVAACNADYRVYFSDFTLLLDDLCILKRVNLAKYQKKVRYFARIQVLILDDFLVNHIEEERTIILFTLLKQRDELGTTTIISSQYNPETWNRYLGILEEYAMPDGIRRRLIDQGFVLLVEKA